jgi:hypothetical protein
VESFGGRIRDELLAVELFSCLEEARVPIEDWPVDYNHNRPHSALGMMTPAAFAAALRQPLPGLLPTATGEGVEERCLQINRGSEPQPASFQPGQQQSPTEEITPTASQANSRSSYRRTPTTTAQLSQQVDR